MEEVISLIFHGLKLVKDFEMNLPNFANQPSDLIKSCDEIIRLFGDARERLSMLEVAAYGQMMHGELLAGQMEVGGGGGGGGGVVQDWLRFSQAMDMVVLHASQEVQHGLPDNSRLGGMGGRELQALEATNAGESGGGDMAAVQAMDIGDAGGSPALQRTRRRNEADRRTLRVPAPRMGNTEVPQDDGYTWRKYGQKEILGSRFPRAYYRCTHQKLYNCPAKKQVQRLDNDPYMFEVTYRGDHTCTMSTTAPSIPPPPNDPIPTQSPPAASIPLSHWLSMDIRTSMDGTSGNATSTNFGTQMYGNQFGLSGLSGGGGGGGGAGPNGTTTGGGGSGAGPSTVRYADYHQQEVADLADAMFNSGSSSNNSMELIFSSVEDKWEGGDQREN